MQLGFSDRLLAFNSFATNVVWEKNIQRKVKALVDFAGLTILLAGIVVLMIMLSQNGAMNQPVPTCPPPLQIQTTSLPFISPIEPPTPWPEGFVPPPPQISTPVVFNISQVIDMGPELPVEQKGEAIVCKPNGTYVKILTLPTTQMVDLPLEPDDVLVAVYSPRVLMGQRPPKSTIVYAKP